MKNKKWAVESINNNDTYVVLFISRTKDNKHVENFTERRRSFITKHTVNDESLIRKFNDFVNAGVSGEVCRMYYSVNARNDDAVYKDLLHFLFDNPDFNLCSLNSKLAGIAAVNKNAKTKRWMFDFDIDDENKLHEFVNDILSIEPNIEVIDYKTPNGYAVVTSRGFDTRELFKKWSDTDICLKRDDLLCVRWTTKE